MGVQDAGSSTYLDEMLRSWAFEFFSDFLGLIMMGPSFLSAFQSLLELNAQAGSPPFVPRHPPYGARALALLGAARALNLIYSEQSSLAFLDGTSRALDNAFIESASNWADSPFSLLEADRISEAATLLQRFAVQYPGLAFPTPDLAMLSQLVEAIRDDVPPAGPYPAAANVGGELKAMGPSIVDFRHILFAGWLRWSQTTNKDGDGFRHINMLCSHAILQQEGVVYWESNADAKRATSQ
jgi:hypothetical protein